MFDHLVQFDPEISPAGNITPLEKAGPDELLAAQVATTTWLDEIGAPPDDEIETVVEQQHARRAFSALAVNADDSEKKAALVQLKTPQAVRHITGMLTAYDWEFIEQAKELRGYTVAKLVEETQNSNANIRLKALALLGKVTEVGLFTEKIEVKQAPASDAELDARIKEKLNKFMGVVDVIDIAQKEEDVPAEGVQSEGDA